MICVDQILKLFSFFPYEFGIYANPIQKFEYILSKSHYEGSNSQLVFVLSLKEGE
jgi:hypothetical protein